VWADTTLSALEASERDRLDLVLVVSELVSNVVQLGEVDDVPVAIHRTGHGWELVVAGGPTRPPDPDRWQVADAGAANGRGLGIVRALVDEVAIEELGDRVAIRCTRARRR
jgi:anti-sigma regulatory factor (Ser/Thr protein kinase)